MSFEQFLQLIRDGEPVTAGTANRPIRRLHANLDYVWDAMQAAMLGSTLYSRRVTVEPETVVGTPVYFNTARQRFERGLAAIAATASGVLQTADSAGIWGIVANKINATLADVLLCGHATVDISGAVDGPVTAGLYYLSGQTEGRLVRQRQPVSVPVLRSDGNGTVFLMPQFVDFLDRHVHHKFPLTCAPAGTHVPPSYGDRHVITDPDDALPGWLPADHASFDGHAPAGAAFGYNLGAHTQLQTAWPPLPISSATLTLLRPSDSNEGATIVSVGEHGKCILDRYGIWWMSNCYNDVPWPVDYASGSSESAVYGESECPRPQDFELTLWFTRIEFATDVTVVRSLTSTDSRLRVSCADGTPATSGDLQIALDLQLVVADNARGYLFFKSLDGSSIRRGPGVEGIYTTSTNVTLAGDATSRVDPNDNDSPLMYHGRISLEVNPAATRELDVALIRLDGAEEEHVAGLMFLALTAGEEQEFRCRIDVPADTALVDPQLKLRLRILGRAAGDLPQLTVTGRRVPRPTEGPTSLPTVDAEFTITLPTEVTLTETNQYVECESEPFDVAAGDAVYYTVRRESTDEYPAQVGVLQQKGILTAS